MWCSLNYLYHEIKGSGLITICLTCIQHYIIGACSLTNITCLPCRICGPSEDEVCQFTAAMPDVHNFPLASFTAAETLKVVVNHLPRLNHIPFVSATSKLAAAAAKGISKCLSDSSIDRCTSGNRDSLTMSSSMQYMRTNCTRTATTECSKTKLSSKSVSSFLSNKHFSNGNSVPTVSVSSEAISHHCSQEFCFDDSCLSHTRSPTHTTKFFSSGSSSSSRQCETSETFPSLNSCNSLLKRINAKKLESSGRGKEIRGKGKVCPPEASSPVRHHYFTFPLYSSALLYRFHLVLEPESRITVQQMI